MTDQTLAMLDKILDELVRKGNTKQERHFQSNVRSLNASKHAPVVASLNKVRVRAPLPEEAWEPVLPALEGVAPR